MTGEDFVLYDSRAGCGIFEDEHLKKKIRNQLKKSGIKILSSVFYMTAQGKYEIHLTLKASKGHIVAMKELASEVGKMEGRIMVPGRENAQLSGTSTAQLPVWKEQDFTRSRVWPK